MNNRTSQLGDFLSLFSESPAPAPNPDPSQLPAGTASFDPNDPAVRAAMAHAREQALKSTYADKEKAKEAAAKAQAEAAAVRKQMEEFQAKIEAEKAEAARLAEEERIKSLPKKEQDEERYLALQRTIAELQQQQRQTTEEANRRIEQWRIEAEAEKAIATFRGEIDPLALDKSSLEALKASIPKAVEVYKNTEQHFMQKFQAQLQQQPPSPSAAPHLAPPPNGFPTPSNPPAVVTQQGPGAVNFDHPMADGGQSYAHVRQQLLSGTVYQPPQPTPQHQDYLVHPQGHPTTAPINPRAHQPAPQPPNSQPPPQGQPPSPVSAPDIDPQLAASNRSDGDAQLSPQQIQAAKQHAAALAAQKRQTIMGGRKAPAFAGAHPLNPEFVNQS